MYAALHHSMSTSTPASPMEAIQTPSSAGATDKRRKRKRARFLLQSANEPNEVGSRSNGIDAQGGEDEESRCAAVMAKDVVVVDDVPLFSSALNSSDEDSHDDSDAHDTAGRHGDIDAAATPDGNGDDDDEVSTSFTYNAMMQSAGIGNDDDDDDDDASSTTSSIDIKDLDALEKLPPPDTDRARAGRGSNSRYYTPTGDRIRCRTCNEPGHIARDCFNRVRCV